MSYVIELSPKAEKELVETFNWYENEQLGLGEKFEIEFFRKISLIEANPLQYPVKKKMHETNTGKFPFLIVYRINESRKKILIISIFHTSRHPKKKY
ncbi:MAG TPA: type II toxin-antitoxin system RelE/ParE family toxin [Mucilaginibacter sp.]|jgi:plasmid stabilization system protein ParE|nr:type II toxin-antitoxin system RelE/ParE family toxin [Mucilaginibacter sp.]